MPPASPPKSPPGPGPAPASLCGVYLHCADGQDDLVSQRIEDAGAAGSHCPDWPVGGRVPQAGQSALTVVWYWPGTSGCQSFVCTLSIRATASGLLAGSLRERDSSFRGLWPQHGLASGRPRFNGRVRDCRVGQAVALTHDGCEPALRGFSQGADFEVAEAAWALEDAGADGGAGGDTKAVQVVG